MIENKITTDKTTQSVKAGNNQITSPTSVVLWTAFDFMSLRIFISHSCIDLIVAYVSTYQFYYCTSCFYCCVYRRYDDDY